MRKPWFVSYVCCVCVCARGGTVGTDPKVAALDLATGAVKALSVKARARKQGQAGVDAFFQRESMHTLLVELISSPACELTHQWSSPLCKTWTNGTSLPCK